MVKTKRKEIKQKRDNVQRLKKEDQGNRKNHCIRFNDDEWAKVCCKAELYAEGEASEWVRYAAQNCVPRKRDMDRLS